MEKVILDLIDTISKLAPELFKLLVRQVISVATLDFIVGITCLCFTVWGVKQVYKCCIYINEHNKGKSYFDRIDLTDRGWHLILLFSTIITGIITVITLSEAMLYILNPEYYAIMNFIKTFVPVQ